VVLLAGRTQSTDSTSFGIVIFRASSLASAREVMNGDPAVRERGFVATELTLLFRVAGLSVVNMWGGTAGNWGRRTLDLDEYEIMIVATKTAEPSAGAGTLPRAA
jgi:hypothetical protein